ncbi:ATP-grasp domain-containing protein, partial [Patescibacteria group bacterium]
MNLKEYQGKELFEEYDIKTPGGVVLRKGEEIPAKVWQMGKKVTIKAQVAKGKRQKAKGIVFVDNDKDIVQSEVDRIFGLEVGGLAVEEILIYGFVEVKNFMYLA